jgi:CheY-like chemotaxis protein
VIAITDNGSGMSPEVLARVLEPFFTTKEAGKGTGLGLSMVYGVISQMGGHLKIDSQPGQGTCVTLYLPRAHNTSSFQKLTEQRHWPKAISMLLVDDDPSTQAMVAAFAADHGDAVISAKTGAEALAILDSDQVVDIVIADTFLSGISGPELIAQSRKRRPDLPAFLLSARPGKPTTAPVGETLTLAKPFGRDAFDDAVKTVFGTSRTATIIPMRRDPAKSNRTATGQ